MAGPQTPILDDFERAPENPLRWFDGPNQRWGKMNSSSEEMELVPHSFACSIGAIEAAGGSGNRFSDSIWHESYDNDQECHFQWTGASNCGPQAQLGEGIRGWLCVPGTTYPTPLSGYYFILHNQTGPDAAEIWRYSSGSSVVLVAEEYPIGSFATRPFILCKREGSTLELWTSADNWIDGGVLFATASDGTYSGGRIGCGTQTNTASFQPQIDNFGGGVKKYKPQIYRRPNE
jgi:hypothetical protein